MEKDEEKKEETVEETEEKKEETPTKEESTEKVPSQEEEDYKALADAHEAVAIAEKERADAAEALIIKNKAIAKRHKEGDDGEEKPLTRAEALELIQSVKKEESDSEESKRLAEAEKKAKEARAKASELARALKNKDTVRKETANTHFDGEKGSTPKLSENSPLKSYKYMGNGVYSKKLASGKTLFMNTKKVPGQPRTWIE